MACIVNSVRNVIVSSTIVLLLVLSVAAVMPNVHAAPTPTLRDEFLVVKPDLGGPGYDQFYPELIVVDQGDQVNVTVRNTDSEGFQLTIENITTATIQPGETTPDGIAPVDTQIPVFNATSAGIFAYSSAGHPEMDGYLVILPSDWSNYSLTPTERHFSVLALPDFGGDGYDKWSPGVLVVNQEDTVSIDVRSLDDMPHGFGIAAFGINAAINPAQDQANGTILPVTTNIPSFVASSAGIFTFLCTVPCGDGHQQMVGTLVVLPRGSTQFAPNATTSYNYLLVTPDYAGDGYDKFIPGVIFVNQGDLVYLRIRNTDEMPHGFTLPAYTINNETINPATDNGNQTTPTDSYVTPFYAGKPGVYEFFCSIPCGVGHDQMIGYLVVLPKLAGPATQQPTTMTMSTGISLETSAMVSFGMILVGFIAGLVVLSKFAFPKKLTS